MSNQEILQTNNDGIVTLTINRPTALNALNKEVFNQLEAFFQEGYKAIDGLKGVIIAGAGDKAFVAGADIKEFLEIRAAVDPPNSSKRGQDVFFLIENFHKPVIALVNGFALGGGCELAMACHMRIATPSAKFGQPEVNLGLIPGYGGTQRLPQLIGKAKAIELLLTGDMIDANEAARLGLVNYVLDKEEAIAKCTKILSKISTKGPISVAKCIEMVNVHYHEPSQGYIAEHNLFKELLESKECEEGVDAFIEKRKPNF